MHVDLHVIQTLQDFLSYTICNLISGGIKKQSCYQRTACNKGQDHNKPLRLFVRAFLLISFYSEAQTCSDYKNWLSVGEWFAMTLN